MQVSHRPVAARPESPYAPLAAPCRTEACLAGCGLAGLLAAYLLAREQRSVVLLEACEPGDPHDVLDVVPVASGVESSYIDIEREHGPAGARVAARAAAVANDVMQAIVRREHIACDFERLDGYFFAAEGQDLDALEDEAQAARRSGVPGVEALAFAPLAGEDPPPCLHFPYQAQVHGPKLAAGLARAIAREGGHLHAGLRVDRLRPGNPSAIETTSGVRIEADVIVVPAPGIDARSTVNAVMLRVPRGCIARALYWERMGELMFSARLHPAPGGGDALLATGEASPQALADWARRRFPRVGEVLREFVTHPPEAWDIFAFCGPALRDTDSAYVSMAAGTALLTRAAAGALLLKEFFDQVPALARETS